MTFHWLYDTSLVLIFTGLLLALSLSVIIGFWLGRRNTEGGEQDSQLGTIQGATLGLLGLLLAFTFAMSAARFDTRRQLVLAEANAIGTTFLRAQLLPEPHRGITSSLLRQYVAIRREFYNAGRDTERIQRAIVLSKHYHDMLWNQAIDASALNAQSIPTGLFIESLNETLDLHEERLVAMQSRVPEIIYYLLFAVAMATLALIGYGMGMAGRKNILPALMAMVLIAIILIVILDLDRPRRGLITISQDSMIQLQESLK